MSFQTLSRLSSWLLGDRTSQGLTLSVLLTTLLLSGCADTRYYWQSVTGHLAVMQAARSIDHWLANDQTATPLHQRLALAQSIRQFSVTELRLPDNASYKRFADLRRPYVVWNVVAAPESSLTLKTWCFPVAGCVGYRGYFDETDARALAAELQEQGLEVSVYGVPAYSTLGWMNWAGGDPILNTFVNYPDAELARMIFHELAHQVEYVRDDTVFNESFASAVERLGAAQWLAMRGTPEARVAYAQLDRRRAQFRKLTRDTRQRLGQIYASNGPQVLLNSGQLAMKMIAMSDFRLAYGELKKEWGGYSGYDAWVAQANNAAFAAQAAYDDLVPGFEALFVRQGRDWQRFYDAVRQLAKRSASERGKLLKQMALEQHLG